MAVLDLDQLLRKLPLCPGVTVLPIVGSTRALQYVASGLKEFVAPNLTDRADVENPPSPAVAVISAAGAVGKSTLAREIARVRSAPLWDLSHSGPVGQHTLSGALLDAFGPQSIGTAYPLFGSSNLFIVIDALDEARVKVNEASFQAFIRDIASLAAGATSPRVLLLGRTQVAETTWLLLEDAGVRTALYVIEPFTRPQANQYIEGRMRVLSGRRGESVDAHGESFKAARDLIFDHLERALNSNSEGGPSEAAGQFLGYAPVLDSIAVLLAREANWHALQERLRSALHDLDSAGPQGHQTVLEVVVKNVLAREHEEKLVRTIKPALEAGAAAHNWSAWSTLYDAEEQSQRLLARILGITIDYPLQMPKELKLQYEECLDSWLPEHPFLRDGRYAANVVFESYLYAGGLLGEQTDIASAVCRRLNEPLYKPSRLFADFYFRSIPTASGLPEVPPAHLGWLYDSFLSAETDTSFVRLSLEGPDPGEVPREECVDVDGEFIFHAPSASARTFSAVSSREFRSRVRQSDVVTFGRYVRDSAITVPCIVALGGSANEFEIGPSVYILAAELRLNAQTLLVGGHTRSRVVTEQERDQAYDDGGFCLPRWKPRKCCS
mgnify:CR=1 FL=1